jgi:Flp pilus assembly pilin Flp
VGNDLALRAMVALQMLGARFRSRLERDDGQALAEYALIMAVIGVAVVIGAGVLFRTAIITAFNNATQCLSTAPASGGPC